jgi:hypothetical protein
MAEAPPVQLDCPSCHTSWPIGPDTEPLTETCPGCGRQTRILIFPALARPAVQGHFGEFAVMEGEATCFYHPQKRALVPCDACGRFLCALCDCEMGEQHLCPACLDGGVRKHRIASLEQSRPRWDQIVWTVLVVGPLVTCFWGAPLTGALALCLIVWKRAAPPSLVANAPLSFGVAAAVAALEVLGGVALWIGMAVGA